MPESRTGRLAGEVAIVTGSTSGLGKVAAGLFAAEGGQVVVTGRNAERGEAVAKEITAEGGDASFIATDLSTEEACQALVAATVERYGSLTVLVNNAVDPEAIAQDSDVVNVSRQTMERMLQVNVIAPTLLCKYAVPEMIRAGRGSIINVSATSGAVGTPLKTAYSASKGGITALTKAIVSDFGRQGVRCNTLQAGYIIHERRHAGATPERERELLSKQITRLAEPMDVAYALLFLASRESEVITGVTLPVDGGATAVRATVI
jgi:NAD(P)-dependent dehydrogenase (short-subunit alcohol dehydrogenase family)